jgi:predicted dehydrogenase
VIRVGIVGCNYGRTVLVPAFRTDPRCEVVALAGTDAARTAELARAAGIPRTFGDWRALAEEADVDVVGIAVPPEVQPGIAARALGLGKAVFVEKPFAADLAGAGTMLEAARNSARPTMIDFNFPELDAWRRAKGMLADGAVGRLRHVVVTWNVENRATRLRLASWRTRSADGGGASGNFVSHSMHYLEWFCGPITGLVARLFHLPGTDRAYESGVVLACEFASGAGGSLQMSAASFLGSGHRIEFYGEDGTLVLANPTADYFRGFELRHGRRSDDALQPVAVEQPPLDDAGEARVFPVSRLVRRFLDACERGGTPSPGFAEGFRSQQLLDAVRRSHADGRWIAVVSESASVEVRP